MLIESKNHVLFPVPVVLFLNMLNINNINTFCYTHMINILNAFLSMVVWASECLFSLLKYYICQLKSYNWGAKLIRIYEILSVEMISEHMFCNSRRNSFKDKGNCEWDILSFVNCHKVINGMHMAMFSSHNFECWKGYFPIVK